MNQLKGGYSKELSAVREQLLEMTSLLELELDFSEEDVEFADRSRLLELLDSSLAHIYSLTDTFRYGNALRNGVPVAIVGAANSGKSTLLNSLVGEQRAIVSDIAGTTRDTVEEMLNIDGHLFRIIDTAGLRETSDSIEKIGIERAYSKLSEASVVLAMVDLTSSGPEIEDSISDILKRVDFSCQKLLILANKVDLEGSNKNVSVINNVVTLANNEIVALNISAKAGIGLKGLREALVATQNDSPVNSGQTIVTNLRHYEALRNASSALESVRTSLLSGLTPDLIAEDLRQALHHLSAILGEVTPDEVLGNIFSRFCVGK